MTADGFTVREVPPAEFWSATPGDDTAETIVEETAWQGAAAAPEAARAMLERWIQEGAWVLGLYEGEQLIGLFDIGRFVPGDYLEEPRNGAGDLEADQGPPRAAALKHLTLWFAIRPAYRGRLRAATFQALSDAFLRHLWDRGIRDLVTVHVLNLAEGRQHAAHVERLGWRTLARTALREVKGKTLRARP